MARNPKRWRLWWLTSLRIVDIQSTSVQRRSQEFRLAIFSYIAFSLFLTLGVGCGYYAYKQWELNRGPKSEYDQNKDKTFHDIEKMRQRKDFRKLH